MSSLITSNDDFSIIAVLLVICAFSIIGEERGWFKSISGVLVAIILAAICASVGFIPSGSDPNLPVPVYDFAFTWLIPFSIPLLLFNVHLKKVFQESGRLMLIFLIGAIGVVMGAVLAAWLLDLGENTYKLAAVYTATYTGGSVNFMAVASSFDFLEDPLFAASIVVDNVFTILFLMLLIALPRMSFVKKYFPKADKNDVDEIPVQSTNQKSLIEQIGVSLAIAGVLVALGMWLAPVLELALNTEIKLDVLLITMFIIILANVMPKWLAKYEAMAFQIGMYLLYVFLAVIGATCDLSKMFTSSPKVLMFAAIVLFVHLAVTLLAGKWLKFSLEEIAIASGANSGGVSISAPMAVMFQMKKAVTPAILIGIMGYVVGTFLGIGVGVFLK